MFHPIWLSLVWGLTAWALPLIARNFPTKRKLWITFLSGFTCALALINVLWDVLQVIKIGDWGALEDTTDAMTVCSVILVLGTIAFNWRLLRGKAHSSSRKFRLSKLYPFVAVIGIYFLCMLLYQLPLTGWLLCTEIGMELYPLLLFCALLAGYVWYLRRTPRAQISWSIPLAVILFPLIDKLVLYGLSDGVMMRFYLYQPLHRNLLLITFLSTAILKYLHWRASKKGASHESD